MLNPLDFQSEEAYRQACEEEVAGFATPGQAAAEYGRNAGMDNPDRAWILTPWDSWEPNPFYVGPRVSHPEYPDDETPAEPGPRKEYQPAPTNYDVPF